MLSFGFTRLPLTWRELLTRTAKEFVADNGLGLAAQLAYYFFFSLFPAVLVGIAFASFFPLEHFVDRIVGALGGIVPGDIVTILQDQIRKISEGNNGGILTFGLVVALWSSSAALMGLIDALNRAYDIEEGRPWWKVRLLALGLTLALAAFILRRVRAGPRRPDGRRVHRPVDRPRPGLRLDLEDPPVAPGAGPRGAGRRLRLLLRPRRRAGMGMGDPGRRPRVGHLARRLARVQVLRDALRDLHRDATARIGGVMVLLLWFYLSGVVFLLGAELNAEIEHASPYGKAVGEKVPGAKRAIGALAYRRYRHAGRPSPVRRPPSSRPRRRNPPRDLFGAPSWRWSRPSSSSGPAAEAR